MDSIIVKTEKTVFGGSSIAKVNNKTIFIPYTLPNETLLVNIVQHKANYDNAEILKILDPSPFRVQPPCEYYGLCGGCNMMHIDYNHQKQLRKQMLIDIFNQNNIDISDKVEVIDGPEYAYRCRFQLHDGGLSQKNSNNIVKINKCLCAEDSINDYLQNTEFNKRIKGRVHLFGTKAILSDEKIKFEQIEIEKNKTKSIKTKNTKKLKLKQNNHFAGTVLNENNIVCVKVKNKEISFDVRGFFQSNLYVFEKVIDLICDSLPGGKNIVDIYAGCGSISCFLADKYETTTLVEHNRDALVFAEKNMNEKPHVSYGLSGEKWIQNCVQYCPDFDACVVDPPRSGIEKVVLDYLCKSNIPYIRSLSCDPSTHARDCKKFIEAGYELEKIYLLDFYPHTSHIESLAIFNKTL